MTATANNVENEYLTPPSPNEHNNQKSIEKPIAALKPKASMNYLAMMIISFVYVFSFFFITLPVLKTGKLSSVWPATDKRIEEKTKIFIISLVAIAIIPIWIPSFKKGNLYLYKNRLEIEPFIGTKKTTWSYSEISVNTYGKYRFTIQYNNKNQSSKKSILSNKNKIAFGLLPHGLKNPEEVPNIINILKNNAASFTANGLS